MKSKIKIVLSLLSLFLISGCRVSGDISISISQPKQSDSASSPESNDDMKTSSSSREKESVSDNTDSSKKESVSDNTGASSIVDKFAEDEKYQYHLLSDGTLSISVGKNKNLESLTIPKTYHGKLVTQIAERGFEKCFNLKEVVIPDSINKISDKAFYSCTSVKKFNIPSSVSEIGDYAFGRCHSLESMVFPEGVTSIGQYIFDESDSLNFIVIPNSVTSIAEFAFECFSSMIVFCKAESEKEGWKKNWDKYKKESNEYSYSIVWGCDEADFYQDYVYCVHIKNSEKHVTLYKYMGNESDIVVPNTIKGMKVTGIGKNAFFANYSLESVVIPEGVTFLGEQAFYGCNALENVTIPSSVSSIGQFTFSSCSSLKSVVIPWGVTLIGTSAFLGCFFLRNVEIPSSVLSIEKDAFRLCQNLESIKIPSGVMSIGETAFCQCYSLTSAVIPNSVTSIGKDAFSSCSPSLKIFCESESRPDGWVAGWNGYSTVIWGSSGGGTYRNFIYGIDIIDEVPYATIIEYVGERSDIIIPSSIDGMKVIGISDSAFENCYLLENVVIPEGVTSIGRNAFYDCPSLTSVTIPNSVTTIGSHAFSNCSPSFKAFCKSESKPEGWENDWISSDYTVVWGYNG